jgi:ABC-type Fe3+-siderophore transport system permease subunit
MEQPQFRGRAFATILMLASFAVLTLSGLVMYFAPHGHTGSAAGWTLLNLNHHQWNDLHIGFALLMLVAGLPHVWMNRRALLNHLRRSASTTLQPLSRIRLEAVAAAVVCAALLTVTVQHAPPVSNVSQERAVTPSTQLPQPGPQPIGPRHGGQAPG